MIHSVQRANNVWGSSETHSVCHEAAVSFMLLSYETMLLCVGVEKLLTELVCVAGKLDEKRAPEADLRSVHSNPSWASVCRLTHSLSPVCCLCFSIFDDVGDYIVSTSSSSKPPKEKDRHRERDRDRDREDDSKSRRHSYFEKPRGDEHQVRLKTRTTSIS